MRKALRKIIDRVLTLRWVRFLITRALGRTWRGRLLPIIGYRPAHMVDAGETVLLGGIFNSGTARGFANSVGPAGNVIVCEANPENVRRLRAELSDVDNVTVLNYAIWSESREMDFLASSTDAYGFDRLDHDSIDEYPHHMNTKPERVTVLCRSLDDIATECEVAAVHHINLTINGAELQAIASMSGIRKNNPGVRLYINAQYPEPCEAVCRKLGAAGFDIFTAEIRNVANRKIRLKRIYALPST